MHTSGGIKREFTFTEYVLYARYNLMFKMQELWCGTEPDMNANSITDYYMILGVFLTSLNLSFLIYKTNSLGLLWGLNKMIM